VSVIYLSKTHFFTLFHHSSAEKRKIMNLFIHRALISSILGLIGAVEAVKVEYNFRGKNRELQNCSSNSTYSSCGKGCGFKFESNDELREAIVRYSRSSSKEEAVQMYGIINCWDVSSISRMDWLFYGNYDFNELIQCWNVSKVTTMRSMFYLANSFNQPIGSWDVSKVDSMDSMFRLAGTFNQPIGGWDVSSVTDMESMFRSAASFNRPIEGWDVSSVTDMGSMFRKAVSFNQPIGIWDVSKVTDMESMFRGATNFNQSLEAWNVNITDISK